VVVYTMAKIPNRYQQIFWSSNLTDGLIMHQ
jgi:hypothetical protein